MGFNNFEELVKSPGAPVIIPFYVDKPEGFRTMLNAYRQLPDANPKIVETLAKRQLKDSPVSYDKGINGKGYKVNLEQLLAVQCSVPNGLGPAKKTISGFLFNVIFVILQCFFFLLQL